MPPVGAAVAVPFVWPLPVTAVAEAFAAKIAGCEIVADALTGQPAPSVAVTEKAPAARPEIVCVVAPFDHKKLKLPVPPLAETVAEPFAEPKQDAFWLETWAETAQLKGKTATVCAAVQLLESVAVTE